jgi:FkbM family methyltransferase
VAQAAGRTAIAVSWSRDELGDDGARMAVTRTLRQLRRAAGAVKRQVAPSPAVAAWRRACREADRTPRRTPGTIELGGYTLQYTDLLTLCPQWKDIFVDRSLVFHSDRDAPRILDCGANVGLASLFFKSCYPAARITAFEADPAIAVVLTANLGRNRFADIDVVAAAVWKESGTLTFRADRADSGGIAETTSATVGSSVEVAAVRLRDYLDDGPIDLLKLDIEGAEGIVLADCAPALHAVRAIQIELHEFDRNRRQGPEILTLLRDCGFTYAITHVTPLPLRQVGGASAQNTGPFRHHSTAWVEAISAWRESAP